MIKDHIRRMFDYNYWCNTLIMDTAENLTPEQFVQQTKFPFKTVRETLVHIMSGERIYRMRLAGEAPSGLEAADFADLAAIRTYWADEESQLRAYLDSLDETDLSESFTYTVASTGKEYERVRVDVFTQLLFHGMQHRAELAQMLTECGHSPGNIDYLVYINQVQES